MKLAECLLLRAENRTKIFELQQRILKNSKIQEDSKPLEDPNDLIASLLQLSDEQAALIARINNANSVTKLKDGRSIIDAIVARDNLVAKRDALVGIVNNATDQDYRLTRTEIKTVVLIDIPKLQKKIDGFAKDIRMLDVAIQELNWSTEI
ncbi:DIP1984 family protein [Erysipelothrix sp. HDW6C]|uniref:DIP1984 family protein n=1 Tax=Erysipelothrix sp. HDW6C TaxID=2714930 RepID=UPI00140C596C|nr:DIP1984 family protein [Erysipelothrix sp. HDW6C]QIK70794.1 DIP1984 family protein [Erysipelothrix sp. HDW6C]